MLLQADHPIRLQYSHQIKLYKFKVIIPTISEEPFLMDFNFASYVVIKLKIEKIQHSKISTFFPSKNEENQFTSRKHVKV